MILAAYDPDLADSLAFDGIAVTGYLAPVAADVAAPYLGTDADAPAVLARFPGVPICMAIDPPHIKALALEHFGGAEFAQVVAADAYVSDSVALPQSVIVQRRAYVSAQVELGEHVKLNVGAQVHHDCTIGALSTIAPGALLMGNVSIGPRSYVGAGAVIRQRIRVGAGSIIGCGAVVVADVPDGVTVVGNPARPTEKVRHRGA